MKTEEKSEKQTLLKSASVRVVRTSRDYRLVFEDKKTGFSELIDSGLGRVVIFVKDLAKGLSLTIDLNKVIDLEKDYDLDLNKIEILPFVYAEKSPHEAYFAVVIGQRLTRFDVVNPEELDFERGEDLIRDLERVLLSSSDLAELEVSATEAKKTSSRKKKSLR